ncbi:MAG: hypothetical protein J0M18_13160 [Ignavibacteria bacterium]|nr:hypothetical protein [Ignavibacteria bacterium]
METEVKEVKQYSAKDLAHEIDHFFFEIKTLLEITYSLSMQEEDEGYNWKRRDVTSPIYAMGSLTEIIHEKLDKFFDEMWTKYVKQDVKE